jgi:hypothetical protein
MNQANASGYLKAIFTNANYTNRIKFKLLQEVFLSAKSLINIVDLIWLLPRKVGNTLCLTWLTDEINFIQFANFFERNCLGNKFQMLAFPSVIVTDIYDMSN